jgi:hypothetical protein
MTRAKYPSELNNKQVRVSLDDYALLKDISEKTHITMAEALHRCLDAKLLGDCEHSTEKGKPPCQ